MKAMVSANCYLEVSTGPVLGNLYLVFLFSLYLDSPTVYLGRFSYLVINAFRVVSEKVVHHQQL
jgi:hypothetical protein